MKRILLFLLLLAAPAYSLSIEEKVGQLLVVHFYGDVANEDAKRLIEEAHVGGFIYYPACNDLSTVEKVAELSASLQELADIPLLLMVDQEGGRVCRIIETPASGDLADPAEAYDSAFLAGTALSHAGVHLNLAPVVDVDQGGFIGDRSYGSDPEWVAVMGLAAIDGYHRAGVGVTLKHFPGHGGTSLDSHHGLPVIDLTDDALYPFERLLPFTDAVMLGHIVVPQWDPARPVTRSPQALNYLRLALGFDGVIITDSLNMAGFLSDAEDPVESVLSAFESGSDLLLLGGLWGPLEFTIDEVLRVHAALVDAVYSGRISIDRLDASLHRIFLLKSRYWSQA